MPNYVEVWQLAKEMGVRSNAILDVCKKLDIPATRVATKLPPAKADRIRKHYANEREAARQNIEARKRMQLRGRTISNLPGAVGLPTVGPVISVPTTPVRKHSVWTLQRFDCPEGPPVPDSCLCCGMRFPRRHDEQDETHCQICQQHYEIANELPTRTLARLRDHDTRLQRGYAAAWHKQQETQETASRAFQSRNSWRATLVEVAIKHLPISDGTCKKCGEKYPCSLRRQVTEQNTGIDRQIERFESMDLDGMSKELYPEDDYDEPWVPAPTTAPAAPTAS